MRLTFLAHQCLLFLAASAGVLLFTAGEAMLAPSKAEAAERVVLKYGPMQAPLSVAELTTFAETGEMSAPLKTYLGLAKQEPQEVRNNLTKSLEVNSLFLDRVLNQPIGERLLDQVARFVNTPSGEANRQALRAALVLSASGDNQITLMETIQNYPAEAVEVDVARFLRAAERLRLLNRLPI